MIERVKDEEDKSGKDNLFNVGDYFMYGSLWISLTYRDEEWK